MPNDPAEAEREMTRLLAGRRTSHDPAWFEYGERRFTPEEVLDILDPYLTERRRERIEEVLERRTCSVAVVVEGMVDTGNVAAVMRTADGFGIQPFHAIDTAGSYKRSKRTSQGAEKWLDVWRWNNVAACVGKLREDGHRIVALHPDPEATPIDLVDFTVPTALALGNELSGLSEELLGAVDDVAVIPIDGFVQSFNISVAAALALAEARRSRIDRLGRHGDLSEEDRRRLRAVFAIKSVRHARRLLSKAAGA